MAVTDWPNQWVTTTSGTNSYVWNGNYTITSPSIQYYSGGSASPAPRPPTALEWLDGEIESVCKLARAA